MTYFGEPPKVGVESAVFLLGTGLSVINSKCVAGGVNVVPEPISRNVIRIVIPKNARFMKAKKLDIDGNPHILIDVHLATPNGISNHLYVEADPADPVCAPNAVASGSPIAFDQETTTLAFNYKVGPPPMFVGLDDKQKAIKLLWIDPTNPAPAKIELCLSFKASDGSLFKIAVDGPLYWNAKDKNYLIETNGLNRLAEQYLAHVGTNVIPLSTSCVEVHALGDATRTGPFATGNALRFQPTDADLKPNPPKKDANPTDAEPKKDPPKKDANPTDAEPKKDPPKKDANPTDAEPKKPSGDPAKKASLNQTPNLKPSTDVVQARYQSPAASSPAIVRANLSGGRTPAATRIAPSKPIRRVPAVKPSTTRASQAESPPPIQAARTDKAAPSATTRKPSRIARLAASILNRQ